MAELLRRSGLVPYVPFTFLGQARLACASVVEQQPEEHMHHAAIKRATGQTARASAVALVVAAGGLAILSPASADETDARRLFKAMSDYMAKEGAISFDFDATLEFVTSDNQKLGLASSGALTLNRPDKLHATRTGGFADVALAFDGKTLTLLGKNANAYTQVEVPGTIDHLVDELRNTYNRPVPAADLLMSNVYEQLMPLVSDAKDLGSGVIGGVECDHLAFRTPEVDWQIWIAQGDRPYPCRYVITSSEMAGAPQYTIEVRAWKTGHQVASDSFKEEIPAGAKKLSAGDLPDFDELPRIFAAKVQQGSR
jgi:hypothetical protein